MKLKIKKPLSVLLSLCLMFSTLIIPNSSQIVYATQNRKNNFSNSYELTGDPAQDILNVALAQVGKTGDDLGYSEEWCANFVSDCADLAGQGNAMPRTGAVSHEYTKAEPWVGLWQTILQAGGWEVDLNSAQPGDIVFFSGHVEIVYSGTGSSLKSIGGNTGNGNSCYSRVVCSPRSHYNPVAVLRPNYKSNIKPSNLSISSNKTAYKVGETINFSFGYENASEVYVLIDANGVRVEPWANVTGKSTYSCSFNEPGYYVYRLYAVNSVGIAATEWQVFTVYDSKPSSMSISCDKDCYAVGETINFKFSIKDAVEAYVLIDANGVRVEPWANVTGKSTYSCSFNEPGYYVYRLYAVNEYGNQATEWKVFTVYDTAPNNLRISCDKNYYQVGETINFNFSVNNASEAYVLIDANGVRVEPWANVTGKTKYSCTFNEPGYYVYRLYAVNKYGTPATEWQVFQVYDSKPSDFEIITDKSIYKCGEPVEFTFQSQNSVEQYIPIDVNGVREHFIDVTNQTSYICSFNTAGTYMYCLYGRNNIGEGGCRYKAFTVYTEGDINLDGVFNITDIVLLQKWILAVPDTHLACWQAADLCEDEKLDVFDLVMIKRKLING